MEPPLLRRRKLALLFLLGVGLPSLALSLLALRGIQNELALLEQRQLDGYRALTDQISDSLLGGLDRVEASAVRVVAGHGTASEPGLMRALDSLAAQHPLIDVVFFLEEEGRIRLPTANLLFRADAEVEAPEPSPWPPEAALEMRRGQEEEFQRNSPSTAIANYQRALDGASEPDLRGQALLAMTRVQRKAGQLDRALTSCDSLLEEYGAARTGEGMPLGPVAFLEKGSMLLAGGDSLRAMGNLVELYGRLVAGEWELGKAQYEFLTGEARTSLEDLASALDGTAADSLAGAFEAAQESEIPRRERAERTLLFQENSSEDLVGHIQAESRDPEAFPRRISLDSGGQTFLVSLLDGGMTEAGVWGLLLDGGYIRESILLPLLEARVDSSSTEWIVRGRDGRTILAGSASPSSPLVMNATIAGSFPPWLLEFYQRPQNPYRLFLASGQSVYLYMFLAIAVILGFGLVLTVRTITRELELARLKSDFVSTVSHEFKSPLTSIRQLSEMLQSGRVPSEERRQRYYDILVEQSARLSSLVTNVLDLARIEEGRKEFRFETVDLGSLIADLAEGIQHRVGYEGFEIRSAIQETLPPVRADPEALRQAISNLLNNAIQYSGESRQVNLEASAEGRSVTVTVQDFGMGIPEAEIGRVFDRFFRGSSEITQSVRGSGLGLTLVREIAEAHGGVVEVESEVENGSTFRIRLPAMTEADHG
jgi:signal transduction histidine kinase